MIRPFELKDIKQVVRLHRAELPGFLSELGIPFLEKFYTHSLSIPEVFTIVEKEDEEILGFATGVVSAGGLYKKIISRDILGFGMLFLRFFIVHPDKLRKTFKTLAYPGFKQHIPELLTIAVAKKHQQRGVGRRLFQKVADEFEKRGMSGFEVSVYERLPAVGFYQKIGCKFVRSFDFLGEKMRYYKYRI